MGFLDRIFGKKRATSAGVAADQARSQQMAGRETGQTTEEQAGTRGRMEAELLGQRQQREQLAAPTSVSPSCPHTTLVPSWDGVADMGKDDKITAYTCEGCQQRFSAAEGRALRATEAARLQRDGGA